MGYRAHSLGRWAVGPLGNQSKHDRQSDDPTATYETVNRVVCQWRRRQEHCIVARSLSPSVTIAARVLVN